MSREKKNTGSKTGNNYWSRLDELIKSSRIVIDHPKGKAHQRYPDLIFPLDYGYLEGTVGGDGDGIDLWLGTARHRRLTAIACTVDMLKKDAEIKLIIGCTAKEIGTIEKCHTNQYMSCIIVRRPPS
jgi:inorganic pyrophosphatase